MNNRWITPEIPDTLCAPAACRATWSTHITHMYSIVTLSATFCSIPQTILLSTNYSCSEEILSIVSLLSVDNVLYNPPARREEVLAARKKFISSEGDHMTLLNIYRAFKKVSGNKVRKMSRAGSCWWFAFMIFISVLTGVVPRELCKQQEHGSGERSTGTTQGYLS